MCWDNVLRHHRRLGTAALPQQVAGETFVEKHLRWSQNITLCSLSEGAFTEPTVKQAVFLGAEPRYTCLEGDGYILTPANLSDHVFKAPCVTPKMEHAFATFNAEHEWKLVRFPSRQGQAGQNTINVTAWWLPAKDPKAPRIVVQHGNNVNFNDFTVQFFAYTLRSLGFACLLPNLRDHGTSGASLHGTVGWGWAYHLDLLGAWDYTVNDPDGLLGGKMGPSKVGILGMSMGGFAASIAFGKEPQIPGAWIDSGVFEPRDVLKFSIEQSLPSFLQFLATPALGPAWLFANRASGVSLDLRLPAQSLAADAKKKKKRPIAVTHGQQDTTVPPAETDQLLAFIDEHEDLYDARVRYLPDYSCGDNTHITMILWRPDTYRKMLCEFWTHVFTMPVSSCKLNTLPVFEETAETNSTVALPELHS